MLFYCLAFGHAVVAVLRKWEQIFYREFDGPSRKQVLVKIVGE